MNSIHREYKLFCKHRNLNTQKNKYTEKCTNRSCKKPRKITYSSFLLEFMFAQSTEKTNRQTNINQQKPIQRIALLGLLGPVKCNAG